MLDNFRVNVLKQSKLLRYNEDNNFNGSLVLDFRKSHVTCNPRNASSIAWDAKNYPAIRHQKNWPLPIYILLLDQVV